MSVDRPGVNLIFRPPRLFHHRLRFLLIPILIQFLQLVSRTTWTYALSPRIILIRLTRPLPLNIFLVDRVPSILNVLPSQLPFRFPRLKFLFFRSLKPFCFVSEYFFEEFLCKIFN